MPGACWKFFAGFSRRTRCWILSASVASLPGSVAVAQTSEVASYFTFRNNQKTDLVPLVEANEYGNLCEAILRIKLSESSIVSNVYVEPIGNPDLPRGCEGSEAKFANYLGAFGGAEAKCRAVKAVRDDAYLKSGKSWADLIDLESLEIGSDGEGAEGSTIRLKPGYRLGSAQHTQVGLSNYLILALPLAGKSDERKAEILQSPTRICSEGDLGGAAAKTALGQITTNKFVVIDPRSPARSVFVFDNLTVPLMFFFRKNRNDTLDTVLRDNPWSNQVLPLGWLPNTFDFSSVIVPKRPLWEEKLRDPSKPVAIFSPEDRDRFVLQFAQPFAVGRERDADVSQDGRGKQRFHHRRLVIPLGGTAANDEAQRAEIRKISRALEASFGVSDPISTDALTFNILRRSALDISRAVEIGKLENPICNSLGARKNLNSSLYFKGRSPYGNFGDDGNYFFEFDLVSDPLATVMSELCHRLDVVAELPDEGAQAPTEAYPWKKGFQKPGLKDIRPSEASVPVVLADGSKVSARRFLESTVTGPVPVNVKVPLQSGGERREVRPPLKFVLVQDVRAGGDAYFLQDFPISTDTVMAYFSKPGFQSRPRLREDFFKDEDFQNKCYTHFYDYDVLFKDYSSKEEGEEYPAISAEAKLLTLYIAYRLAQFLPAQDEENFSFLNSDRFSQDCLEAKYFGYAGYGSDRVRDAALNKLKGSFVNPLGDKIAFEDNVELRAKIAEKTGLSQQEVTGPLDQRVLDAIAALERPRLSDTLVDLKGFFETIANGKVYPFPLIPDEDAVRFAHGLMGLPVNGDGALETGFNLFGSESWHLEAFSIERLENLVTGEWPQFYLTGDVSGNLSHPKLGRVGARAIDGPETFVFAPFPASATLGPEDRFRMGVFDLLTGAAQEFGGVFHDSVRSDAQEKQNELKWQDFATRVMLVTKPE